MDSVRSDIVPIGDVVSQDVAASTVVQAGSTVTITISLGPIGGTSTEFVYRYRYGNQY